MRRRLQRQWRVYVLELIANGHPSAGPAKTLPYEPAEAWEPHRHFHAASLGAYVALSISRPGEGYPLYKSDQRYATKDNHATMEFYRSGAVGSWRPPLQWWPCDWATDGTHRIWDRDAVAQMCHITGYKMPDAFGYDGPWAASPEGSVAGSELSV